MKKILLIDLIMVLLLISCVGDGNYNEISEMNKLYPIEIVYFDEETANEIGDFPISRKYYADLIENIEKQNPKYVILKFFLDRESEEDLYLSKILNQYDNVFNQSTTFMESNYKEEELDKIALKGIDIELENYSNLLLPNELLKDSFCGVGLVDFIIEENRYIDFPVVSKVDGYILPSLGLLIAKEISKEKLRYEEGQLCFGEKRIELENGRMRIDISEPKKLYKTYSMIDILDEEKNYDFENKIVIIFIEAPEVRVVKTKYKEKHNKAEIVADSINTILKVID